MLNVSFMALLSQRLLSNDARYYGETYELSNKAFCPQRVTVWLQLLDLSVTLKAGGDAVTWLLGQLVWRTACCAFRERSEMRCRRGMHRPTLFISSSRAACFFLSLHALTFQDIVTRHAHSTGHHVERRFGWDTHGLPVEHEIDKKLGITSKADVMALGIKTYNKECRDIVMRYSSEWKDTVERMGRWIDFDTGYKTLDLSFMESVWWVFGQLWEKQQVYRGLRVMPYSTGCTTPLSNFEAGEDYRMVSDPAVTVAFPLVDDPSTSLLAWTTTPYTLPSNLGLCVHPEFTYIKIHDIERDQNFILLESLIGTLYKELQGGKKQDPKKPKYKKVGTFKGSDMKGWRYVPMFDYFTEQVSYGIRT